MKKHNLLLGAAVLLAFATSTGLAQNTVITGTTNITTSISNFNIWIGPTNGSTPIGSCRGRLSRRSARSDKAAILT